MIIKRTIVLAFMIPFALITAVVGAGFLGGEAAAVPEPIGCGEDGYCNTSCTFDPDCGPPQCEHNKPCTTDRDCAPLGYCAVYRLCVCTG